MTLFYSQCHSVDVLGHGLHRELPILVDTLGFSTEHHAIRVALEDDRVLLFDCGSTNAQADMTLLIRDYK